MSDHHIPSFHLNLILGFMKTGTAARLRGWGGGMAWREKALVCSFWSGTHIFLEAPPSAL